MQSVIVSYEYFGTKLKINEFRSKMSDKSPVIYLTFVYISEPYSRAINISIVVVYSV